MKLLSAPTTSTFLTKTLQIQCTCYLILTYESLAVTLFLNFFLVFIYIFLIFIIIFLHPFNILLFFCHLFLYVLNCISLISKCQSLDNCFFVSVVYYFVSVVFFFVSAYFLKNFISVLLWAFYCQSFFQLGYAPFTNCYYQLPTRSISLCYNSHLLPIYA